MRNMIVALFLALIISDAMAHTHYSVWVTQNESWKRGFVYAMASSLKIVQAPVVGRADPELVKRARAYEKCIHGFSDIALLKVVDAYISRNPSSLTGPFGIESVVLMALSEMCDKHLE